MSIGKDTKWFVGGYTLSDREPQPGYGHIRLDPDYCAEWSI